MARPDGTLDRTDAFASLAEEVVEPVRRYLARRAAPADVDDVLSETLLVCWRRIEDVPADARVAWSIGVARSCLANVRRAERRRWLLARRVAVADPPPVAAAVEDPQAARAAERVSTALADLPVRDAEVLRLWAWEELGATEVAQVLGVSVNAATVRLHRAKKKLRARLESGAALDAAPVTERRGGRR